LSFCILLTPSVSAYLWVPLWILWTLLCLLTLVPSGWSWFCVSMCLLVLYLIACVLGGCYWVIGVSWVYVCVCVFGCTDVFTSECLCVCVRVCVCAFWVLSFSLSPSLHILWPYTLVFGGVWAGCFCFGLSDIFCFLEHFLFISTFCMMRTGLCALSLHD
jgi:hypothetical protein